MWNINKREYYYHNQLKVIMVAPIGSNQYNIDYQSLEVIRRLQSLGINPTGNINADRQTLQKAEYIKRQNTLSANNVQNLNNLEGSGFAFSDTLNSINQSTQTSTNNTNTVQPNQQIGASQIAMLNRYQLGL